MPDLVDEVEEEIRQERTQALLKKFGGAATGLALLVLAGVGGWQGWTWWENRAAEASAAGFLAATQAASVEGADLRAVTDRMVGLAQDAPPGYRVLARLRAAALAAEAGERPRALELWNQVANDSAADPLYRDLATLLWGLHGLQDGNAAEVETRLAPLAAAGPWQASAREVRALAALARNDAAEARRRLTELARDDNTPRGVRERAQRLLSGLEG